MKAPLLQRIGAWMGGAMGREHPVVRLVRPAYERMLDRATSGKGYLVTINGTERFYVNPQYRAWYGDTYEPQACTYLKSRVQPGALVLNIGAHVGIYALSLATWAGRSGRVFAFEPNPATRDILADQIVRNDLFERIEIVPSAVSSEVGTATFSASGAAGFNRLGAANPERTEKHSTFPVTVTTIDTFCAERGVAPDWITLDIEGFEAAALEGARQTIASRGSSLTWMVEMHPSLWPLSGTSRDMFEALLDDLRLTVTPLTGQADAFGENGVVTLTYKPRK